MSQLRNKIEIFISMQMLVIHLQRNVFSLLPFNALLQQLEGKTSPCHKRFHVLFVLKYRFNPWCSALAENRHFQRLSETMRKPKPNKKILSQLLTLDFESRRDWIEQQPRQDVVRLVLDRYPCFRDADQVQICI